MVLIGGTGADNIIGASKNDKLLGGQGADRLSSNDGSDTLEGGEGNDTLNGGLGDDTFIGGAGDDMMKGGSFLFGLFEGTDTSQYRGALADYDIEFLPDNIVRIRDKVSGRDGYDTLEGIDFAQFSDKRINLAPGQDIAFVIDTTGSMFDDIDAVQARANDIINAIYDGDRGFLNSRIAVVGYNDPGTSTFLSFTNQPKIDDRKTAAIDAINSISVGGGGDIPELVNAGLIRALSGGAGEWREEAIARRIILFGDAPPKDTALRDTVLRLAADVGVELPNRAIPLSIAGDIETSSVTSGLTVTRFNITAVDEDGTPTTIPVEIFTVLIGSDPTTRNYFQSIATATGGQAFSAANASEVVDALIEALGSPIAVNDSGSGFSTDEDNSFTTVNVLNNDSDPDSGDILSITNFDTSGTTGLVIYNGDGTFNYDPNGQFESLNFGESATDNFTYTISDSNGNTNTATVTITINGVDEVNIINGTPNNDRLLGIVGDNLIRASGGKDLLRGNSGRDRLFGEEGNDRLFGFGGDDILVGGNGFDRLRGGDGNDLLDGGAGSDRVSGGTGADTFVLAVGNGLDTVRDFEQGTDTFRLNGELSFSDLSFSTTATTTTIKVTANSEELARLNGVFALTSSDFA